jgi:dinuclear metal center YbgI/SA1388 family protein
MACTRDEVFKALEELAPPEFAESWDNTGLLVDPDGRREFVRAFVTIDLTQATMDEADEFAADLIIAYHPPIFSGLKRLRKDVPGEDLIVRALRAGQTIYSPHTALDVVAGGMNDWLVSALGPGAASPIVPHALDARVGLGRQMELAEALDPQEAVRRVKAHLGLSHVRFGASSGNQPIKTVAVCPGAGGSVFEKVGHVDLLITGEMRHHDVLGRNARGTHVLLTDHTNTERGYLPEFGRRLMSLCPGLLVSVSRVDRDPLQVV